MSEYRYFEFQAINQPLTARETDLLPPEDREAVVCSRASKHGMSRLQILMLER